MFHVFFLSAKLASRQNTFFYEFVEVSDETVLFQLFKRNNFSYGTICPVLFFSSISLLKSIVHFTETIMQRGFVGQVQSFRQVQSFMVIMFVGRSKSVELLIYFFYQFEMLSTNFFLKCIFQFLSL